MESGLEIHPFENFVPAGATHLVLGTFPTLKRNWKFNFYYPGRSNFFWRIISDIYLVSFQHQGGDEVIKERSLFLAYKGIAISDVIYSCYRRELTSKDSDLVVVEKMNVLKILHEHPTITTVILTGSSGKVSAHSVFYEHLAENGIAYDLILTKPPISGSFVLDGREVKVHSLYSTSGINIGRYKQALEQYRSHLPG